MFNRKYLPYISCLFHCIYWDSKFPKYIKNKHLERLAKENNLRLLGISDVTCDSEGSIECLKTFTSPDQPFFFYDPLAPAKDKETFAFEYKKHRIMYLALDYLPCELAFDASTCYLIQPLTSQTSSKSGYLMSVTVTQPNPLLNRDCCLSSKELSSPFMAT